MTLESVRKFCPGCAKAKVVSDFQKDAAKRDKLCTYCRDCIRERGRIRTIKGRNVWSVYDNPTPLVEEKKCSRCKEVKPAEEFNKNKRTKTGLGAYCRVCENEKRRKRK